MAKLNAGARRLKEILEAAPQAMDVAVALGCTPATVYNLVNGHKPSYDIAIAAERAYKIPPKAWTEEEARARR